MQLMQNDQSTEGKFATYTKQVMKRLQLLLPWEELLWWGILCWQSWFFCHTSGQKHMDTCFYSLLM